MIYHRRKSSQYNPDLIPDPKGPESHQTSNFQTRNDQGQRLSCIETSKSGPAKSMEANHVVVSDRYYPPTTLVNLGGKRVGSRGDVHEVGDGGCWLTLEGPCTCLPRACSSSNGDADAAATPTAFLRRAAPPPTTGENGSGGRGGSLRRCCAAEGGARRL